MEPEIEITRAMIEAGQKVLVEGLADIGPTTAALLAEEVFKSMLAANLQQKPST